MFFEICIKFEHFTTFRLTCSGKKNQVEFTKYKSSKLGFFMIELQGSDISEQYLINYKISHTQPCIDSLQSISLPEL